MLGPYLPLLLYDISRFHILRAPLYEDAFQLRQKVLLKKVKRFPQILILKLLKIGCTLPSKDFLDVSVTCQFSRKQVPLEPVRSYFLFSSRHVAAQKPEIRRRVWVVERFTVRHHRCCCARSVVWVRALAALLVLVQKNPF